MDVIDVAVGQKDPLAGYTATIGFLFQTMLPVIGKIDEQAIPFFIDDQIGVRKRLPIE
jgi:hypothetical protein